MNEGNGWIDRRGKYYALNGVALHSTWASEYLKNKYGMIKAHKMAIDIGRPLDFQEVLYRAGWIKIMRWPNSSPKILFKDEKGLTYSQKKTLYEYCKIHLIPLPFEDIRFIL